MSKDNPRWLHEIPKAKAIGKRELTEQEKQEAKEFEEAVKSGKILEWFNKNS